MTAFKVDAIQMIDIHHVRFFELAIAENESGDSIQLGAFPMWGDSHPG